MSTHPLPAGLTSVGGGLDLDGYEHPLPDDLLLAVIRRHGSGNTNFTQDGSWVPGCYSATIVIEGEAALAALQEAS